jgi:PAS domain S-box-containing protein
MLECQYGLEALIQQKGLEDLLNNLNDGIILIDKDSAIVHFNKRIEKLLNLTSSKVLGRDISGVLPTSMGQEIKSLIDSAREGKRELLAEMSYRNARGKEGYTCTKAVPLLGPAGEYAGLLLVITDITERKRLEAEKGIIYNINRIVSSCFLSDIFKIIASELRRVIDFDRVSIALLDEKGQKFEVLALAQEYGDSKIKEGHTFLKKGSLIERVFSTGKPYIVEETSRGEFWSDRVLLKEGIRSRLGFPLECKGRIIGTINFASRKSNNFPERHFHILEQIAPQLAIAIENTRLFNTIRESEKKYRDLYDYAPDMYFTHDENGLILDCNQTGAELLGYHKEELIGRPIFDLQTPKTQEIVRNLLPKRLRGLAVKGLELELLRKDGTKIDVSLNDNPIYDETGRIIAIRSAYRDITARKKMEEQLIEMEKLASTGRLVASVAHEINNPLEGLSNYLHLLSIRLTDEEQKRLLQLVMEGCNRIGTIVRRLLESHQQVFEEKVNFDVNLCVRNVVNLLESRIRLSNIDLVQELDANLPQVSCDPTQVEQVFTNVILNAVDAMPTGGILKISTTLSGNDVQISFADTGCGIPEKDLPKLFEPFFSTKKGEGTGLGLWISYNIVKAHGGSFHVESRVGNGTTVSILLPWTKTQT